MPGRACDPTRLPAFACPASDGARILLPHPHATPDTPAPDYFATPASTSTTHPAGVPDMLAAGMQISIQRCPLLNLPTAENAPVRAPLRAPGHSHLPHRQARLCLSQEPAPQDPRSAAAA